MNRPLVLLLVTGLAFGCNFPLGKLAKPRHGKTFGVAGKVLAQSIKFCL